MKKGYEIPNWGPNCYNFMCVFKGRDNNDTTIRLTVTGHVILGNTDVLTIREINPKHASDYFWDLIYILNEHKETENEK